MDNPAEDLITVEFVVVGLPAPQGSKRHVGHGRLVESSKDVKPWRIAVALAAINLRDSLPDGHLTWPVFSKGTPVGIEIIATVKAPVSVKKTLANFPTASNADADKLARSTLDGLSDSMLWHDDGLVVDLRVIKTYPSHVTGSHYKALPHLGAQIRIWDARSTWNTTQ